MSDNEKREQVINGLECCKQWSDAGIYEGYQPVLCESCPRAELQIDVEECHEALLNDAIALLKVQEPITGETSDGYHVYWRKERVNDGDNYHTPGNN